MKIFVAGGTGAIGRALLEKLLANGHVLVALTRSPEKAQALVEQGIGPARERWSGSLTALSFQSDLNERNLCVVRQMVESCCFIRDCIKLLLVCVDTLGQWERRSGDGKRWFGGSI